MVDDGRVLSFNRFSNLQANLECLQSRIPKFQLSEFQEFFDVLSRLNREIHPHVPDNLSRLRWSDHCRV